MIQPYLTYFSLRLVHVSPSDWYARHCRRLSSRAQDNEWFCDAIRPIRVDSDGVYGSQ